MIKRYLLSFFFVISAVTASVAQTPYWMQQATGAGNDEVTDIVSFQNDYYITGYYSNTTTFGSTVLYSQKDGEAFVAKLNQHGEYVWAKKIGGLFTDRGIAISVMPNGNVIATGHFVGTITLDNHTISSDGAGQDIFVVCFDPSGNVLWFKRFGGRGIDVVSDIQTDNSNNIILTGQFIGNLILGNDTLESGVNPANGASTYDIFIAKLNASGNVLWSKHAKSTKNNRSGKIGIGSDNSVFVSGNFTDTLTLVNVYQNNSLNMGFVARFDSTGSLLWFRRVQSSVTEIIDIVCTDSLLYMTGAYSGNQRFANDETTNAATWQNAPPNAYAYKYYVAAYDYAGKITFMTSGGSDNEAKPRVVCPLPNGGYVLSGEFKCQHSQYQAAYGSGLYLSRGLKDIFMAEFNSNDSLIWAKQIGGVGEDEVNAMVINSYGQPVIAGSFTQSISSPAKRSWGSKPWYFIFNTSSGFNNTNTGGPLISYCNDPEYNFYAVLKSQGSKDLLIANIADTTRSTMDVFTRQPGACDYSPTSGSLSLFRPNNGGICQNYHVRANVSTANIHTNGLNYRFYWNNVSSYGINTYAPGASGIVQLRAEALNTCYGFNDSIPVEIFPVTPAASITVTGGVVKPLSTYSCRLFTYPHPDSVLVLQGNDPGPLFNFEWRFPDGTVHNENPIVFDHSLFGSYTYRIYNPENGCSNSYCIRVLEVDSAGVGIACENPERYRLKYGNRVLEEGDTLRGCLDDTLTLTLVDISVDPTGIPALVPIPGYWFAMNENVSVDDIPTLDYHSKLIALRSDMIDGGRETIGIEFTFGTREEAVLAFSALYYIELYPQPVFNYNLSGSLSEICPEDTGRFSLETAHHYTLELDPSNVVESNTPLIFYTFYPQKYLLTMYDTTEHGCTDIHERRFEMAFYQAPDITLQPVNGIVCDNEPVTLSIPGATELIWVGPAGDTLSNEPTYSTTIPGLYYAVLKDMHNCKQISNTVNVRNRSSFGYELTPERICPGQTAEIELYALAEDNIKWLPPFSGNDLIITTNEAGIYRFTAPICGVIDTFEVVVPGPEFTAGIANEDSLICPGDVISLKSIHTRDVSITWLNNFSNEEEFQVTEGGDYILELIDASSCATYDTVSIYDLPAPEPPLAPDYSFYCDVDSVYLTSVEGDSVIWFLGNNQQAISPDFTFYAEDYRSPVYIGYISQETGCISKIEYPLDARKALHVPLADSVFSLCQGERFNIHTTPALFKAATYKLISSWENGGTVTSDSSYTIPAVNPEHSGVYSLIYEGDPAEFCVPDTVKYTLEVRPVPQLSILSNSVDLCDGEMVRFWASADSGIAEKTWLYTTHQTQQDTLFVWADSIPRPHLILQYDAILENGCTTQLIDTIQRGKRPPDPVYQDSLIAACSGDTVSLSLPGDQKALWFIGTTRVTPQPQNSYQYVAIVDDSPITVFNSDHNGVCPTARISVPVSVKPRISIPKFNNVLLCPGDSRTFTFNPAAHHTGYYHWKDMVADSIIATNANQLRVTAVPGTYGLFAFTDEHGSYMGEYGCGQDSTIFTITVQTLPTLSVAPFSNDTICLNNGTPYSSTTSAAVNYSRLYVNGNPTPASSCSNCQDHRFLLSHATANDLRIGENTLRTVVQTTGGCFMEYTDTIEVTSPPAPNFSMDNYLVCVGDTVFIKPPVGGLYDWVEVNSFGYLTNPYYGLPVSFEVYDTAAPSINYVVNNPNPSLYINSVDPVHLCRSEFYEIPVLVKPTMNLPVFNDQGICANDSLLIAFSPGGELIGHYQWTLPDGSFSIDSSFVIQGYAIDAMGQYQLIAQANDRSCGTDTALFTLTGYEIPLVELVIDSFRVCTKRDWKMLANITGDAQITWNYDFNVSQENPLIIHFQNFSGDSLLISGVFTNPAGCVVNKSVGIAVYPTPETPELTVPATICTLDTVMLTLNNFLLPGQQFRFQSNVDFWRTGNKLYYKPEMQDTTIHIVSYISTEHCTSDSLTHSFPVHQLPIYNLGNDSLLFCLNEGTLIDGPSGYSSYQWSTGENTEDIEVFETGTYSLLVRDDHGCLFSDTIFVLGDWPLFQFSSDTITFCLGDPVLLKAPEGFHQYQWNTGSSQNTISITETGEYILAITDTNGCIYADTVFAQGGTCRVDNHPNVFTPNGDGYNDKFSIDPFGMSAYRMVIYDRWGRFIAEVGNNDGGWGGKDRHGKKMPEGTYYFVATVNYINKSMEEIKGMIQLMD